MTPATWKKKCCSNREKKKKRESAEHVETLRVSIQVNENFDQSVKECVTLYRPKPGRLFIFMKLNAKKKI